MNCAPTNRCSRASRGTGGFTLAEALAALVFMAIVIPVAVQGLRIANLAGQVATAKAVAARVAENVLSDRLVTGDWQSSSLRGETTRQFRTYRWSVQNEPWEEGTLRELTVEVYFDVQGQEYDLRLATLADPSATLTDTNTTATTTSAMGGGSP
jgi:type II secretory pathway pseudopilin PulG